MKRGLYIWTQEEVDKYADLLDEITKDDPNFERRILDVRDLAFACGEESALDPGSAIAEILEADRQIVRRVAGRYRSDWSSNEILQFHQFCWNHSDRDLEFDVREAEHAARRRYGLQ